jgi:hypothetical protein
MQLVIAIQSILKQSIAYAFSTEITQSNHRNICAHVPD